MQIFHRAQIAVSSDETEASWGLERDKSIPEPMNAS